MPGRKTSRVKKSKTAPYDYAWLEHSNQEIIAHPPSKCEGQPACPLHNRSVHTMRAMTQTWRADRGIIERRCEHNVGHPDPDQWWYWVEEAGESGARAEMRHGCDGCCVGSMDAVRKTT